MNASLTDGKKPAVLQPCEGLSAAELLKKRAELLEEAKQSISSHAMLLLADPQTNVSSKKCGQVHLNSEVS